MTNKIIESMIEDYRRTIERLQKECVELTDANILLIGHIKTTEERLRALSEKDSDAGVKQFEECKSQKTRAKELEKENEALKAQVETFSSLMNVYKDISKGRQDSKSVLQHIEKLERKLSIGEDALKNIKTFVIPVKETDEELIFKYSEGAKIARQALQKMEKEDEN